MKPNYDQIARDLMLAGRLNLAERGVAYRAGKTADDVRHAKTKALKNGGAKFEYELSMFAAYLKGVFKAAPK